MFRFYQDAIRFSNRHPAARSHEIDILHALGSNRVIAFTRSAGSDRLLVVASLRDQPFLDGYVVQTDPARLPDGRWRERFNSDASIYGGNDIGNFGADVPAANGRLQTRIPANGFIVFQRL
jgi:1,4-alpha-glucan branching enzyme